MTKTGKLDSWEGDTKQSGSKFEKDDFLNMKDDGKYILRIVEDAPYKFRIHWADDVQGKIKRVNCAEEACPLCAEGVKAQDKFMIPAINRERNRVQLVEFGRQVYNQIANHKRDAEWGDPRGYDIKIDRDLSRGISSAYLVTPLPRNMGPISKEEELMVKDFMSRVDVSNLIKPDKPEDILRKLGRIEGGAKVDASSKFKAEGSVTKAAAAVADDDDFDFN